MTPRLVFHVGDFKTGTTAIQTWLAAQGPAHGVFVPRIDMTALAESLKYPETALPAFQALGRALRPALRSKTAGVAVVSSEHFEHADPASLARAVAVALPEWAGSLRVLAYVRPHDAALIARYGESVKIGNFTGDLAAYLDWGPTRWRLATHRRFLRWRAAFGADFALRLYDRRAFPGGDVIRDFALAVMGDDPGPDHGGPLLSNPSLGVRDLAMLRALHRAIGTWPDGSPEQAAQWAFGREIGARLALRHAAPQDPLRLHKALAQRLFKLCARDAAAMDADFFAMPVLGPALAAARKGAPASVPQPDPDALLSADARAVLALWGESLATGLATPDGAAALHRIIAT